MPLDDLPSALFLPTWDDIRDQYIRDVKIRNPEAVVIEGTKEFADACAFADQAFGIYFNAKTIGDFVADINKSGAALDRALEQAGTKRLPASGGSGYVRIGASVGGGVLPFGAEIRDLKTGFRFICTNPGLKTDQEPVAITGVDTGPLTNLPAGSVLEWSAPPPGINPQATIIEQIDGSGLSGGRNLESDGEAFRRLVALRASPPASGNDAEYQATSSLTPALTIQQVFTYPCIRGPGTTGVTFTLRPGTPGANRIPNGAQLTAVLVWILGKFPADDGVFMCDLTAQPVEVIFKIDWAVGAASWTDASPWPPYNAGGTVQIDGTVTPDATSFRLSTTVATIAPQIGQTIAVYDQPNAVFRRKKILTIATIITGKSWDITVDTTNASSDVSYTPIAGQTVGPWSDSLSVIVPIVTDYFDSNGPGEQVDPLPDPGLRQRRSPPNPTSFASSLTNRIISPMFDLLAIGDVELVSPAPPFSPSVGTLAVASNLLTLGSIAVYPE